METHIQQSEARRTLMIIPAETPTAGSTWHRGGYRLTVLGYCSVEGRDTSGVKWEQWPTAGEGRRRHVRGGKGGSARARACNTHTHTHTHTVMNQAKSR